MLTEEEKTDSTKFNAAGPQINEVAQSLLYNEQRYSANQYLSYSSMSCLMIAQKTKEVRIVKFLKSDAKTQGIDDLQQYTRRIPLLKVMEPEFDEERTQMLFRILLKEISLQLDTLGLLIA